LSTSTIGAIGEVVRLAFERQQGIGETTNVGGCDLDCLPQGWGPLEKLSDFDLSNNKKLVKVSKSIEKMK
jgi:hypothetical protein